METKYITETLALPEAENDSHRNAEAMNGGDALFEDSFEALLFAFNYSGQSYNRPWMNRMAARAEGCVPERKKGLFGLDGAAQAGMIRAEVRELGKIPEAILTARFAPHHFPCVCASACCSGKKANAEWVDAVALLADHMRAAALAKTGADYRMRRACVARFFSANAKKFSIEEIARACDVSRNTASAHVSRVARLLRTLEASAQDAIAERLHAIGMV